MNRARRDELLAAEAADWVIALEDADQRTREAFVAWLRTSPEHIREFLAVSAIWGELPELSSQPSAEELVAAATKSSNVVAMRGAQRLAARRWKSRSGSIRRWPGRIAAAVLAGVAAGAMLLLLPTSKDPDSYATMIGELYSVPLPDGSLVTLNTRSAIRIDYSSKYRDIHLGEGEALFEAVRDTSRPFRVIAGQAMIEAVGTQFNVRKVPDEVTVTVAEGEVKVSSSGPDEYLTERGAGSDSPPSPQSVVLKIGQQARLRSGYGKAEVADVAIEKVISWRERRLIFESLPLKQVIDEFNRYNDPPALIADKQLESLPISGVFRSNDRDSFFQFLHQMELAEHSTRADGTLVLSGKRDIEPQ